jgi:4-alpha-glucanotransferase
MADVWSITDGYFDVDGGWHATSDETRWALRQAMGAAELDEPPAAPPMWFVEHGSSTPLESPGDLRLEDSTDLPGITELPPDLPIGYHELTTGGEPIPTLVVVTPRRCPEVARTWGWATQLYALRSADSWGIGDLGDLRELARWSRDLGAGVLLTNPFHADVPVTPQQPSPYFASSRVWRNVNLLRIADIPGAAGLGAALEPFERIGRQLNTTPRLDRDAVLAAKRPALEALFADFETTGDDAFDAWCETRQWRLHRFALFCALADVHGRHFPEWPVELRHPGHPAVAEFATAHAQHVRFHQWCQWHLERQLVSAGSVGVGLVGDLAVGFESGGADAWSYQDELALDCRVGAPPDTFNDRGQDWGLPPFVPWKLRVARYEPFITTLRAAFTGCAGLRIDHVMGLFRLYWIPPGAGATEGAYVRYPHDDLFDLLALEAHRAGAMVIGEDLGTVEDEVRAELSERRVLSTKVVWFEEVPPEEYPVEALASVTTHDLPTIAGVWSGADLAARRQLGHVVTGDDDWFRSRLAMVTGATDDTPVEQVITDVHRHLGASPAVVRLASLDDAVANPDRPNMPGTVDEWPNWRIPLPVPLEAIEVHPIALGIARSMGASPAE